MSDSTQTITRSAARFFSGTMLSRLTGLLRDMAMAFAFGTESALAAFMVAFRFAHLLRRLLGEGALQTTFIPQFEEMRKEGEKKALFFFRDLLASLTVLLLGIILLVMAGLQCALSFELLSEGTKEILSLTTLMMPSLLFICLFGLNASLLQCEKSYFTPSVAPIAFNIVWIAAVLLLRDKVAEEAMPWLSIAIIVACMGQWAMTLPRLFAIWKQYLPERLPWQGVTLFSEPVRRLAGPLFLGLIGVAASQINNALDALFARFADAGGPAMLWYAIRLQQLPLALFGIALSGALLPPLSRAMKEGDTPRFRSFLSFAMQKSMLLMIPFTFILFAMGDLAINLVYGRGSFTDSSTSGTTLCLWAYTAGLIPMALVLVLAPAFYAQKDYRTPTKASLIAVALNIALNTWLIAGLDLGAASVALATSVSAWWNAIYLAVVLQKRVGDLFSSLWIYWGRLLAISMAATAVAFAARYYLFHDTILWQLMSGQTATFPRAFSQQCMQLGVTGVVFLVSMISLLGNERKKLLSSL